MPTAVKRVLLALVSFLVLFGLMGYFLGLGPLSFMNKSQQDIGEVNKLIKDVNATQTAVTTDAKLNNARATLQKVVQDAQTGAIDQKLYLKVMSNAGKNYCNLLTPHLDAERAVLESPDWPASIQPEVTLLNAVNGKTAKAVKTCANAK